MVPSSSLISCNFFNSLPLHKNQTQTTLTHKPKCTNIYKPANNSLKPNFNKTPKYPIQKRCVLQISNSVLDSKDSNEDPILESDNDNSNSVKEGRNWTTSILLFVLWGALLYYVFIVAPNQTPTTDMYFLKKLLNLTGNDGFEMNTVIVSLWYLMGLWPLVYGMLLIPTGRSSSSKIPVWPFLVLSFFGGAYALLPCFVFWRPPPPPVDESELGKWPLNFLESKLTAGISLAAGVGLFVHAGLANGDVWKEFYQYLQGSKFIHIMSLDFTLLSSFAPFWVYNDMTSRKWYDKGSWLLPISLVPFIGPAIYLFLRPSLSEMPVSVSPAPEQE